MSIRRKAVQSRVTAADHHDFTTERTEQYEYASSSQSSPTRSSVGTATTTLFSSVVGLGNTKTPTLLATKPKTASDPSSPSEKISSWKPLSKTAIGRLNYHFEDLPHLIVVEVKVTAGGQPIKSRKLRHKALSELIGSNFSNYQQIITVNMHATPLQADGPISDEARFTDHLIIPSIDENYQRTIMEILKPATINLKTLKKHVKDLRGKVQEKPICCTINSIICTKSIDSLQSGRSTYWNSLDVLIRDLAGQSGSWGTKPKYGIDREFSDKSSLSSSSDPFMDDNTSSDKLFNMNLRVRQRPSIDIPAKVLSLDFDLVPYIPVKKVHAVLFDLFGSSILDSISSTQLLSIKHVLVGLAVRCDYLSRDKNNDSRRKGQTLSSNFPLPATPERVQQRGRRCRIKDIKLAGDVGSFDRKDKSYTVHKYFNELILTDGKTLQHPSLPLANIGTNRDVWVPLEMLDVNHEQTLAHTGQFTKPIKARIKKFLFYGGERMIRDLGDQFWEDVSIFKLQKHGLDTHLLLKSHNNKVFIPAPGYNSTAVSAKVSSELPKKNITQEIISGNAAVIHVSPKLEDRYDAGIAQLIEDSLSSTGCSICASIVIHNEWDLVIISNEQSKLRELFPDEGEENKIDFILAVVDDRGRSKSETRNIIAELHKLGERRLGAIVVCVKRRSLMSRIQNPVDGAVKFPISLLAKINHMLGRPIYDASEPLKLGTEDPKKLMVVAAHISHPAAHAAENCPSVTSIVASRGDSDAIYPGTARLQQSLQGPTKNGSAKGTIIESSIVHLRQMMEECCTAWAVRNERPSSIVFYRDSIGWNDRSTGSIVQDEVKNMKKAIRNVFGSVSEALPELTYVVVNANSASELKDNEFLTADGKDAKYRYHVHEGDSTIEIDDLKYLTTQLTTNSPLSPRETKLAKALPLMYAKKLADRTYDYFRFCLTRDYSRVPMVMRQTPGDTVLKRDLQMVAVVNNYLLNRDSAQSVAKTDASGTDVPKKSSEAVVRWKPWKQELDDKMFYL